MNTPPPISPLVRANLTITYQLTRWDLVTSAVTILFRNRVTQAMVLIFLVVNGAMIVGPGFGDRTLVETAVRALAYFAGFAAFLTVTLFLFGVATAFLLSQRGVVGQHVLEVTEQGLIERTDVNESIHKWDSISRIVSTCGHLYIYLGGMNAYQIPRNCLAAQELAEFEAEVRTRVNRAKAR